MGNGSKPSWVVAYGMAPQAWRAFLDSLRSWLSRVALRSIRELAEGPARLLVLEYDQEAAGQAYSDMPLQTLSGGIALSGWVKDLGSGDGCTERDASYLYSIADLECVAPRLVGEFALAQVGRERVLLMTDVYATRPIYYYHQGELLLAASDLRLLLCCDLVPVELRPAACLQHLGLSSLVGENEVSDQQTYFRHIRKVPPATVLTLQKGRLAQRCYFGPDHLVGSIRQHKDFTAEFRRQLNEVTADRIRAFPSTLHLSGGVDSSTVLAAVKDIGQTNGVSGVNLSFRSHDLVMSQDSQIVRQLMRELGVRGAILWGDDFLRISNAALDDDPLVFLDGPDASANPLAKEAMANYMLSLGAQQAVTGEFGDVLLGEQAELLMLDSLVRAGQWSDLWRVLDRFRQDKLLVAMRSTLGHVLSPWMPGLRDSYYCLHHLHERELPPIPHYFTAAVQELERKHRRQYYQRYRLPSRHKLLGHRYMQDFLWPRAAYFDAMSVYVPHSHPFLDRRLMEFIFLAPTHIHCDYGKLHLGSYAATKALARNAYQGVLPDYARLKRTKTSYAHMARKMLLNSKADLLSLFSGPRPATAELGLIDRGKFWNHLVAMLLRAEDPNNDLGVSYQYLRGVIDLEIWLRNVMRPVAYIRQRCQPRPPRLLGSIEVV